jgi:SpoVK/Ycf46/Vps4 family AAA+-type ATPase
VSKRKIAITSTAAPRPANLTKMFNDIMDLTESPDHPVEEDDEEFYVQYGVERGNTYRPTTRTVDELPPGSYGCLVDDRGVGFEKHTVNTAELIRFPDSLADEVINEFDVFWTKKEKYEERGEPHKRGFLLHGPPGGGKTSTIAFIIKDFVAAGGIVFEFGYFTPLCITQFRSIEPDRKILVVMEDIDAMVHEDSEMEQRVLQFLDGSVQHTNTIIMATTNYPEKLSDRIVNRPSRFDRVTFVGVASEEDRRIYLKEKAKTLSEDDIAAWAKDTEGYTFAHLKELIIAVEIFELDYSETLERLGTMRKKKASSDDYEKSIRGKKGFGFGK